MTPVTRTHRQAYEFIVECYKDSVRKKISHHMMDLKLDLRLGDCLELMKEIPDESINWYHVGFLDFNLMWEHVS